MAGMNKDLRNQTVDGSSAKDVDSTKMLDPNAKEWSETGSGVSNDQQEYINKGKVSGPFGAKGHGG